MPVSISRTARKHLAYRSKAGGGRAQGLNSSTYPDVAAHAPLPRYETRRCEGSLCASTNAATRPLSDTPLALGRALRVQIESLRLETPTPWTFSRSIRRCRGRSQILPAKVSPCGVQIVSPASEPQIGDRRLAALCMRDHVIELQ